MIGNKIHLAIIPDGNRRYGEREYGNKILGHVEGARSIFRTILWFLCETECNVLSIYCFSEENWKRSKEEITAIMSIAEEFIKDFYNLMKSIWKMEIEKIDKIINTVTEDENLKKQFFATVEKYGKGYKLPTAKFCMTDSSKLPKSILYRVNKMNSMFENEQECSKKHINFCLSYSGRKDAFNAVKLSNSIEEIPNNLILKGEPDIVIRTSGEQRISNFAIWQTAYSEWFFVDKYWPEFNISDLEKCVADFKIRNRRHGC